MTEQERTRAERIRLERGRGTGSPAVDGASKRRRSRESGRGMPPVMSRNSIGVNTVAMDERQQPRRRYDVALSSPGAEIQLPAVPVISNLWRVVSGVLSAAFIAAIILLWKAPYFAVDKVIVQGAERFSAGEISRAINAVGNPVFAIHPDQLERDLQMTYSGFSSVDVQVDWPADVNVIVEERNPLIAWNWEGHIRWVDGSGIGFDPHGDAGDVITIKSPILPATQGNQFLDSQLVRAISNLAEHAPQGVDLFYDPEHGLGWRDQGGWKVYFGSGAKDMEKKMSVYQNIIRHLDEKGIQPYLISVEYLRAPYFRMGK